MCEYARYITVRIGRVNISILTRPVSEYSDVGCSGPYAVDDGVQLESSEQGLGVFVVEREGQGFGSDVRGVVLGSDPLELNLSASDLLFNMVYYPH